MKCFFFCFFFIFLLTFVNAFSLEASPNEIYVDSFPNQKICKDILIDVSEESNIIIEDRWSEKGFVEKILVNHKLAAEELNVVLSYDKQFRISQQESFEVCFSAREVGFYHGIILIKGENAPAGVGVWVNLNVTKQSSFFTGFSIDNSIERSNKNRGLYLVLIFIVLVLVEVFILVSKKNKNH